MLSDSHLSTRKHPVDLCRRASVATSGSMSVSLVVSVDLWDNFTKTQDTLFPSNVCLSGQERIDLNASVKITNTTAILAPGCSHTCQS